jgi:phenylpropionate dioxygenase-like ring-hydroxylating dioxygenase large terminal subunit
VDPGFLELEKETVFFKTWQYAGPLSKLKEPGDYFTGSLLGRGFVVCMDDDRSIRAFHNICSHRAAAVADGAMGRVPVSDATPTAGVSGLRFECPYHGWQFDMRGRFRGCKVAHGLTGALRPWGILPLARGSDLCPMQASGTSALRRPA